MRWLDLCWPLLWPALELGRIMLALCSCLNWFILENNLEGPKLINLISAPVDLMETGLQFDNFGVGTFSKLTNSYYLVATGGSERFYGTLQAELADVIPVVKTSIGGYQIVGRLIAGNKNGLLVPHITTNQELHYLRNSLPDSIVVHRLEEKLCSLGSIIACNDHVAVTCPGLDLETEEIIADVLDVELRRLTVAGDEYIGSHCALSNMGGLVHPYTTEDELDELSMLLDVPLVAGTVNGGSGSIAAHLTVNDRKAFCGSRTTETEISFIKNVFSLENVFKLENGFKSGGRPMPPTSSVCAAIQVTSAGLTTCENCASFCQVDTTATDLSLIECVFETRGCPMMEPPLRV